MKHLSELETPQEYAGPLTSVHTGLLLIMPTLYLSCTAHLPCLCVQPKAVQEHMHSCNFRVQQQSGSSTCHCCRKHMQTVPTWSGRGSQEVFCLLLKLEKWSARIGLLEIWVTPRRCVTCHLGHAAKCLCSCLALQSQEWHTSSAVL